MEAVIGFRIVCRAAGSDEVWEYYSLEPPRRHEPGMHLEPITLVLAPDVWLAETGRDTLFFRKNEAGSGKQLVEALEAGWCRLLNPKPVQLTRQAA